MRPPASLFLLGFALLLTGCGGSKTTTKPASALSGPIRIALDLTDPARSRAVLPLGKEAKAFQVGYGRYGVTCPGSRFEEGYTPLGRFRVNAILSKDQFVMDPKLIALSGKSQAELKTSLFQSMNAIDFSGDGEVGEYGIGYISLAPMDSVKQPFTFNTYDGKFRWYSFAIHGSNNDKRIGQKVTGGCVNVAEPALKTLLSNVKLGDEVVITANGPCTP
ncbi:MAG: L,D-transpeptidase [Cyanobacteria bacterium M_surface_10_m1_298]|nr:L,D-transpeptidase [Cyanobacteria bacterium M_surface_10_m1_298]